MVQASDYNWGDSGIYIIKNKVNGKEYVGKSKELTKRNRKELNYLKNNTFNKRKNQEISNHHLQRSFNKYGEENFEFITIKNNICPGLLGVYEIFEIAKRNTNDPEVGYNKTIGGEGCLGYKHTEETIKKISEAKQGEKNPMYGKSGEESPTYGKPGYWAGKKNPEQSERMKGNQYNKGKEHTDKTKMNMSKTRTGENNANASINEDDARKIIFMLKEGNMTHQQIADYIPNATKRIVDGISAGYTWKNVKVEDAVRDIKHKISIMTYRGAIKDIATEYNVKPYIISKIKNGYIYSDVKIDEDDD